MERRLLSEICQVQGQGGRAVLVTIIETRGSTPRKAGAQMLVFSDGRTVGTIGGGCGEAEVKRQALVALDENQPQLYTVTMRNEAAADEGMVCGGSMEVFLQLL